MIYFNQSDLLEDDLTAKVPPYSPYHLPPTPTPYPYPQPTNPWFQKKEGGGKKKKLNYKQLN